MRLIPVFFLLAALSAARPLPAQAPPASAVVGEISASGSQNYSEQQIVAMAGIKPGDTVTRDLLQATANYLAGLGVFSQVNYRFTTNGARINLSFDVQDAPVAPVLFDNFPWFRDEELLNAIRQAVPLFNGVAPQQGSLLNDISTTLGLLLRQYNVTGVIGHELLERPLGGGLIMRFHVEGPTLTVASVAYSDPFAQNSQRLAARNADLVGKPFSRLALEVFLAEHVRPLYLTAGHLQVQFAPPQAGFTADPNQPLPSEVAVLFPITPGPAYRLGEVTWTGNTVINRAPLDSLVTVKRGEVADGVALDAIWQRVRREYARRGHRDFQIDPQPRYSQADGTVSYNVVLTEGPQYIMGELIITGLSLDAERALRSAWRLNSGSVFDGAYIEDMLARIAKPSSEIFGRLPVHYSSVGHLIEANAADRTVAVMIDFQR
jgi:outer membrane protein assembly factor BamA